MAEERISLVFSDFDSTLAHKPALQNAVRVGEEDSWVAENNISLLQKIAECLPVYIVTGRRFSGFQQVAKILPFCGGIIEHGCIIIENNVPNPEYFDKFRPYVGEIGKKSGPLWAYEAVLNGQGFKTDSEGRWASFRIKAKEWSEERKHDFMKNAHPDGLCSIMNQGNIDIMPKIGGKHKAIDFLLGKYQTSWLRTACLGDDYNDLDMLSKAGFPITHKGAVEDVQKLVRERQGYISPVKDHDATSDMLSYVLRNIQR